MSCAFGMAGMGADVFSRFDHDRAVRREAKRQLGTSLVLWLMPHKLLNSCLGPGLLRWSCLDDEEWQVAKAHDKAEAQLVVVCCSRAA
jgi:hypothetical protein